MITLSTLVNLLNENYLHDYQTKIEGAFDEPFYKAGKGGQMAEIQFSHDYIRSALHELAHWCVAGVERRKSDDFGYWYAVDGRDQEQQNEFFKVEIKPQTIEWAFSIICGVKFEASVDNLHKKVEGVDKFEQDLMVQMQQYLINGFPKRVKAIIVILARDQNISAPYESILLKWSQKI